MQKTHTQSMLLLGKIIMQYLRACTSPPYSNVVIIYWQSVKMQLYQVSIPGAGNSARQEWYLWGQARAVPRWIKQPQQSHLGAQLRPSAIWWGPWESIFKDTPSTPNPGTKMMDGERRTEQSVWCLSRIPTAKLIVPELRSEMLLVWSVFNMHGCPLSEGCPIEWMLLLR